jgi:hypothetical protein
MELEVAKNLSSAGLAVMISAEKARLAGKTGEIKQDIQEHIEWLERRLAFPFLALTATIARQTSESKCK